MQWVKRESEGDWERNVSEPSHYRAAVFCTAHLLTTVRIPEGVDGKAFALHMLNAHGVEIGNGLGDLAGQVWRIGLMGTNSKPENVDRLLNLLEQELPAFRQTAAVA